MSSQQTPPPAIPVGRGLPAVLLIGFYIAVGTLPLWLAWGEGASAGGFWRALSNGMAMVAFALLCVQFFISGRIRWVSGRFGVDRLMLFHQLAARVITVALLVHPLLYVLQSFQRGGFAAAAERLSAMLTNPALTSGLTAWALLVVVMALALLRDWLRLRYETWRITHGLGAAAIVCAGLHHTITVGSSSEDLALAQVWIVFGVLALGALVYLYIVRPWQLGQQPFYISNVTRVGDRLWSVTLWPAKLKPVGLFAAAAKPRVTAPIAYEAGQFAYVTLGASPFVMADHPFSFASAPDGTGKLKFLIKEAGDFTNAVGSLKPHTRAYVDGPFGAFTLRAGEEAAGGADKVAGFAFIAGGVGIAPILSLLRDAQGRGETRPLRLLAGNRVAGQIVYGEEMDGWAAASDFRVRHVLQDPPVDWTGGVGLLDEATVGDWIDWPQPESWLYFLCGPRAMREAATRALLARGVPGTRIIDETLRYE
ncbi:MAG: ferric reductase-like transmembrane domain-containing protein [Alphaproteobacteria bacterium]